MLPRGSSNRGARGMRGAKTNDGGPARPRGRGRGSSKTVRFASPLEQSNSNTISPPSKATESFSLKHSNAPFGIFNDATQSTDVSSNSLAAPSNLSGTSTTTKSANGYDIFGKQNKANGTRTDLFGAPVTGVYTSSAFGAPSGLNGVFKPSSLRNSFSAENTVAKPAAPPIANVFSADSQNPTSSTPSTNAISSTLRGQGIIAPSWPETREKSVMEAFWKAMKGYRTKARAALIRAGLLDDPEKPKKLSEAIDFRGTCEGMCPEFEKINRIIEHDVQAPEKDGYEPSPPIMVKALARAAAGQDAPLPEDIRSPAALRRTLDYLINNLLERNDLPEIHGFLWDRTRAIRRDFVFQQSSMNSQELLDQVYCLENITRFHVIALHQMSRTDIVTDDFSEQQEVEQLGKALLSLIHAYEDCNAQSAVCENEKEFRAYYALFNSYNTGILEAVQDWGWKYWGESDEIRIAVSLVESLQNVWDAHGPLKPPSATDIAQNAYHRFFSIIRDRKVSYTMACFAEIHFNKVRKAALKTILAGYRKQRDQTKDWTLRRLNTYLCFDDEQEVIDFGEAHGLKFEVIDDETCLSFETEDSISDPVPQLKQYHSKLLVERKRGEHKLPAVINQTVFEEIASDEGMFVPESASITEIGQSSKPVCSSLSSQTPGNASFSSPSKLSTLSSEDPLASQVTSQRVSPFSFLSQQSGLTPKATERETKLISPEKIQNIVGRNNEASSIFSTGPQKITGSSLSFLKPGDNVSVSATQNNTPFFTFKPRSESIEVNTLSSSSTGRLLPQVKPSYETTAFKPVINLPVSDLKSSGIPNQLPVIDSHRPQDLAPIEPPLNSYTSNVSPPVVDPSSISNKKHFESKALAKQQPVEDSQMLAFANWIARGEGGLINQFIEITVESILSDIFAKYDAEKTRICLEHEERLAAAQAASFRQLTLARKYGHRWRLNTRRLWLKRRGREAREARRRMAEEKFRNSKATQRNSVIDEFKSSASRERRLTVGQMLLNTGVLDGIHQAHDKVRSIVEDDFESNMETPTPPSDAELLDDNHIMNNRSLDLHSQPPQKIPLDSSFAQGGSRIHLIPNYNRDLEGRRQPNGVQTDYFRLKARGIITLPDGTPLASSAAIHLPNQSQFLNGRSKKTTSEKPANKLTPRSVPGKLVANEMYVLNEEGGRTGDIEVLNGSVKTIMAKEGDIHFRKKRLFDEDDEELFAKAKKIREQMDEGAEWFRMESQKSMSRSMS